MSSPRLERLRWLAWLRPAQPLLLAGSGLWDLARRARHADFAAWCQAHPGTRCALWIGSPWLSDLVCAPGLPLRDSAAQIEWARRVLVHYHGAAAGAWPLAAWRRRAARGVSALHGVDLAALRATAAAQRVRLGPVRPLWPQLLVRLLAQRPALRRAPAARALLVEGCGSGSAGAAAGSAPAFVTVLTLQRGAVTALHRRRLDEPQPESLQAIIAEHATEHVTEHAADAALPGAVLLFDAPALSKPGLDIALDIALDSAAPFDSRLLARRAPAPAPDFQRPLPQPGALAWAWCAASLLVLGVAALEAGNAWQARAQTEALAVAQPAPRRSSAPVPVAAVDAQSRQRLAHPWREVFLASETPAAAGLAWLALEHQIGGDLRLQGLAADGGQVQRVAAALRASPRWREVLVARLEAAPQGRSFEIVARPAGARR